ncbi:MAG TPA: cation:proton antiporter [Acidimicrobiia bacterium]|nr:cation:proton antiporter [Acidimicrobiia bacterium]
MDHNDFYIFGGILGISVFAGLIAMRFRQPVIVAFIAVGVGVGPVGLGWVEASGQIELLAQLGIAILLFLIGLKLDLHLIRTIGLVALATGIGQVAFTSLVGFLIAVGLGLSTTPALYVAIALTFSSTIIVIKLLTDKRELEQLHGRIAIGFLIVQDIIVILVMIALTAFSQESDINAGHQAAIVLGKGLGLLAGLYLISRYLLSYLLSIAARSRELLVVFAIAFAVGVASFTDWLGFSTEVGAFLAGLAIAFTPYRETIGSSLISLRNFLLLFFFLELGARLEFTDAPKQIIPAIILSVFVLLGKPIIMMTIMGVMKYPARVSFLTGVTVAQISEFSLILAALGLSLGHIDNSTVGLITVVGLITISISTYLTLYSHEIYDRVAPTLSIFERKRLKEIPNQDGRSYDIVIYGYGRYGSEIANNLATGQYSILIIDFDPVTVNNELENVDFIFGDAEDLDLLSSLPLETVLCVICAIPAPDINIALAHELKRHKYNGLIALTAHNELDARKLDRAQPDFILEPFVVAANDVARAISEHSKVQKQ